VIVQGVLANNASDADAAIGITPPCAASVARLPATSERREEERNGNTDGPPEPDCKSKPKVPKQEQIIQRISTTSAGELRA
jgi:hypothetical protein